MRLLSLIVAVLVASVPLSSPGQDKPAPVPLDNSVFAELAKRAGLHPMREPTGNEFAEKKFKLEFEEYLKSLPGQQVRWAMPVLSVSEKGIEFGSPTLPVLTTAQMDRGLILYARFYANFAKDKTGDNTSIYLAPAGFIADADLEQIKRGDNLTLSGTILRVRQTHASGNHVFYWGSPFTFTIADARVAVPKQ